MASPSAPKDKFFERVINPYLAEVLHHPQTVEMREEVLHICDVEGPRRTGSVETNLEAMEQEVLVSMDGGAWTQRQLDDDHGVHQQPQAGCQSHWGYHLQASREN